MITPYIIKSIKYKSSDKGDQRIKYEEHYLKKLSQKMKESSLPKGEFYEEIRRTFEEKITVQVEEAMDYLKEREQFWHYLN